MPSPVVLFALIYLCGLQRPLGAMPTCKLQRNLVQSSQKLLTDLGTHFPHHCSPYNANITFPTSILPEGTGTTQCRKVLWVVYEILNGTRALFSEYNVKEAGLHWNLRKLSTFRNLQQRLLNQGQCFSLGSHILEPYYADITAALQHKHSATCGWMVLRRDVLWVLQTALKEHHGCFM